jgi:hypothetical protein
VELLVPVPTIDRRRGLVGTGNTSGVPSPDGPVARLCENHFGEEPNVAVAHGIETFAWDDDGNLPIKTYYPMPESLEGRNHYRRWDCDGMMSRWTG